MVDVGCMRRTSGEFVPTSLSATACAMKPRPAFPIEGNWAPRVSLAWGLGHNKTAPKTVLRGGYGIFYDRFSYDYLLQAERYNGITQQQYMVANPNFYPLIPTPAATGASLSTTSPTIYQVQIESACALHHGSGVQPGAASHQECDGFGHIFEFAWQCISCSCAMPMRLCRARTIRLTRPAAFGRLAGTTTFISTTPAASSSRTS